LLRRFYPSVLSQTVRAAVRNFIKRTNLDSYECLSHIYDFVAECDPTDQASQQSFSREMRQEVDQRGNALFDEGERIISWLNRLYENRGEPAGTKASFQPAGDNGPMTAKPGWTSPKGALFPYRDPRDLEKAEWIGSGRFALANLLDIEPGAIPYETFRKELEQEQETEMQNKPKT